MFVLWFTWFTYRWFEKTCAKYHSIAQFYSFSKTTKLITMKLVNSFLTQRRCSLRQNLTNLYCDSMISSLHVLHHICTRIYLSLVLITLTQSMLFVYFRLKFNAWSELGTLLVGYVLLCFMFSPKDADESQAERNVEYNNYYLY